MRKVISNDKKKTANSFFEKKKIIENPIKLKKFYFPMSLIDNKFVL